MKHRAILAFVALLMIAVAIWFVAGCDKTSDESGINLPTSPAPVSQSNQIDSAPLGQSNQYLWSYANCDFGNFDVNTSDDPFLIVQYYAWLHRDIMNFLLDNYVTYAGIQGVATQMPGLYFGGDMPNHEGWMFDSTDYVNASIGDIHYWSNECIKVGIMSQSFANDLVQTMEQVMVGYWQRDFNLSDKAVESFVSNCPTYSMVELALTGIMVDSYNYEKAKIQSGHIPPGQTDSGWTILCDLLGGLGGGALTKTPQDAMGGGALASAAYEAIANW